MEVLESAARLQQLVPDAVLVGGSAAAYYARHRVSFDHDHVVPRLADTYDMVLDALEREPEWVTNRVTSGRIILGELGGIESGVRQLIRTTPLEVAEFRVGTGRTVRVPTFEETLRIKAFLVVKRNQVRDYLDVAALADSLGLDRAADVLNRMDRYYADQARGHDAVSSQVVRQLGSPRPKDSRTLKRLPGYKGLTPKWHNWCSVRDTLTDLAATMIERKGR